MKHTALITGSTSGIGKSFAEILAQNGYNLVLVSKNLNKLKNQKINLNSHYNIEIEILAYDLSLPNAAKEVLVFLESKNVFVDTLINNAGFNEAGSFLETAMEKEQQMINLHILFTTKITKLLLPQMLKNNYGKIVNLGSTGSYIPTPLDSVYSATKSYILSFSKALSYELKGTGVSVTCLCPGATATEFAEKAKLNKSLLFKLFVMKPNQVAKSGYESMIKCKKVKIVGLYNKLMVLSSFLLPSNFINYLTKIMMK